MKSDPENRELIRDGHIIKKIDYMCLVGSYCVILLNKHTIFILNFIFFNKIVDIGAYS